jgi:D-alanyl-D-alanine carboxypeptidase/D-alanyl-D-alanine-endopeptidase (penicillin-binding protein 4)
VTGRGATVRRVLGGLLLAVAVVLVVVGLRAPGAAPAATPATTLGTPLWSLRRTPQAVIDAAGDQTLAAALANRAAGLQSCTAVRDDAVGTTVTATGTEPLTPGSTMKLLTGTAALASLGSDFHFTTTAVAPGGVQGGAAPRL